MGSIVSRFDWRNPDYAAIFLERARSLETIRANPDCLPGLFDFYQDNPIQFIIDWGVTYDPRNVGQPGKLALMPFVLFPKQIEWCEWALDRWRNRERGLSDKSRDWGLSWLAISVSCTLCNFNDGMTIGFGSRKEDYVDKSGDPDCLFWKARAFMDHLPAEFQRGWSAKSDAPYMRILFPATGSVIKGEAGNNIGRGGRSSIYWVDEAAYIERPQLIEASLSQTTNCRIDISSANGMANPFAQRRFGGKTPVFTCHWRDDPRKDDAWYARQTDALDEITVAQEIDINYAASTTGVLIPAPWIHAAVDAHLKLGLEITGVRRGALDIADEGPDLNSCAVRRSILLEHVETWSGKGDDIFGTVERAFDIAEEWGFDTLDYDADGMGAGVRGDARVINEKRRHKVRFMPWRASGGVWRPDRPIETAQPPDEGGKDKLERRNEDYFLNMNAQAFWSLRLRFQRTFRAVKAGTVGNYDPDSLISLCGKNPELSAMILELSQPTYTKRDSGKIQVVKTPDGTRSPNRADGIKIAFAPGKKDGSWLSYLDGTVNAA